MTEARERMDERVALVLKASREDSDMTQPALADKLHWTRNMIANLETGRRVVSMTDFVMIARALNVEPDRLLRRILLW